MVMSGSPTVGGRCTRCCVYRRRARPMHEQSEKVSMPRDFLRARAPQAHHLHPVCHVIFLSHFAAPERFVQMLKFAKCTRSDTSPALEVPYWKCHDRLHAKKFARIKKGETIRDGDGRVSSRNKKTEVEAYAPLREFSAHMRNISHRAFVIPHFRERDRRAFEY